MSSVVNATAHGLIANDPFTFGNVLPEGTGIVEGQVYYVLPTGFTANSFIFSETVGGASVILTESVTSCVIASGRVEYTAFTDPTVAMAPPVAPTAPTGLALTTDAVLDADGHYVSRIKATWGANTQEPVRSFVIEFSTVSGNYAAATRLVVAEDQLGTNLTGVAGNVTHYARLAVQDVFGQLSAWSAEDSVLSAKDTAAPSTPTGLVALDGILSIGAEWTAVAASDLSHYEVQVDNDIAFGSPLITYSSKTTVVAVQDLPVGTWYLRIRALDLTGNASAWTAGVSAVSRLVQTNDITASAITVSKRAWKGDNILDDSSFEATPACGFATYNTATTDFQPNWAVNVVNVAQFGSSANAKTGSRVLILRGDGVTAFPVVSSPGLIPVQPGRTYRIAGWSWRGASAATARVRLEAYDSAGALWLSAAAFFDNATTTPIYGSGTYTVPTDGTVSFVKLLMFNNTLTPANTVTVAFEDVELMEVPNAVENTGATVTIDETGITILNGKLTIQDEFGKSTLTSGGFAGSWEDFAATGLYNGSFKDSTAGAVLGRTAFVPYWTLANITGTTTWLSGAGFLQMRWTTNTHAGSALSDKVRVKSGVRLAFVLTEGNTNLDAAVVSRVLRIKTYDVNGTFIENIDLDTKSYTGGTGATLAYTTASFTPKVGDSLGGVTAVHFIAVELRVTKTSGGVNATYRVLEVSIMELPPVAAVTVEATASLTLTTAYQDIPGVTTTRDKGKSYLCIWTTDCDVTTAGTGIIQSQLMVDGAAITTPTTTFDAPTAPARATVSQSVIVSTSPSGSGIVKVQAKKSIAAGVAQARTAFSSLTVIPL